MPAVAADEAVSVVRLEQQRRPGRGVDWKVDLEQLAVTALEAVLRLGEIADLGLDPPRPQRVPLLLAELVGRAGELRLVGVDDRPCATPELEPDELAGEDTGLDGGDPGPRLRGPGERAVVEGRFDEPLGPDQRGRAGVGDCLPLRRGGVRPMAASEPIALRRVTPLIIMAAANQAPAPRKKLTPSRALAAKPPKMAWEAVTDVAHALQHDVHPDEAAQCAGQRRHDHAVDEELELERPEQLAHIGDRSTTSGIPACSRTSIGAPYVCSSTSGVRTSPGLPAAMTSRTGRAASPRSALRHQDRLHPDANLAGGAANGPDVFVRKLGASASRAASSPSERRIPRLDGRREAGPADRGDGQLTLPC